MGIEEIALDFIRVYKRIKEKSFSQKEEKSGQSFSSKGFRRAGRNKINQDKHTS